MKLYLIILLSVFTVKTEAQVVFNSLLKNAPKAILPYTTQGRDKYLTRIVLHGPDSLFVVTRLKPIEPKVINRYGDSPFGQIDCQETIHNQEQSDANDCLELATVKEVAILSYIKMDDSNYLLHVELASKVEFGQSKNILISMNENGDVREWFFSDGTAGGGNENGTVSRDFTVQKNFTIDIEEYSWGKNNIPYSFKASYEVVLNRDENEDYTYGGFKLKNLSLKY